MSSGSTADSFQCYTTRKQKEVIAMTESMLLEVIKELPPDKVQEVYDFARFLAQSRSNDAADNSHGRIAAFESEDEMLDFVNYVGKSVYAN
jgi:hypothetical protein